LDTPPTNPAANGEWRKIGVHLRRSGLRIRARLGYRAPQNDWPAGATGGGGVARARPAR